MSELSERNLEIVHDLVDYNWAKGKPTYKQLSVKYGTSSCRVGQIFNKTVGQLLKHYKLCVVFHKQREDLKKIMRNTRKAGG